LRPSPELLIEKNNRNKMSAVYQQQPQPVSQSQQQNSQQTGGNQGPPNPQQFNNTRRLNELLEAIRNEFDAVTQDTSIFRLQRDDFEHKSMRFIVNASLTISLPCLIVRSSDILDERP
jgi:hypothetical protein